MRESDPCAVIVWMMAAILCAAVAVAVWTW